MSNRVSVIIPAYNKADLTVKTVKSVLCQTYKNIEIIVIDDGSTDGTNEALQVFGNQIHYVAKENGGACSARNYGIKLAKGDYVAFLDCDDVYLEDKIEQCVRYLEEYPQMSFVHTAAYFIDDKDNVVGEYVHPKSRHEGHITNRLILGNYICNSTPVIRKGALVEAGFFDETIFAPADWDMWLRLSETGGVGYINRPLTKYRVTGNYTYNKLDQSYDEELVVLKKFFERHPGEASLLKGQVYSNFYLRYAQCYFLKGNYPRLKNEFMQSVKANPLNVKAFFLCIYYFLARSSLRSKLEHRILRGSYYK